MHLSQSSSLMRAAEKHNERTLHTVLTLTCSHCSETQQLVHLCCWVMVWQLLQGHHLHGRFGAAAVDPVING